MPYVKIEFENKHRLPIITKYDEEIVDFAVRICGELREIKSCNVITDKEAKDLISSGKVEQLVEEV